MQTFLDGKVTLLRGDCNELVAALPENSIDSVVCDPPYALVSIVKRFGGANAAPAKGNDAYTRASAGFMGKQWDTGEVAFSEAFWVQVLRVLKPGGHLVAFSGTRTYHRMAVAIEDAGFEIRDQLAWCYGSGFPKSHNVSKGLDKRAGAERAVIGPSRRHGGGTTETIPDYNRFGASGDFITAPATEAAREWQGWGTALKPAWEPIVLARKPLSGTVAETVLQHGTGAINIDGCRVESGARPLREMDRRPMGGNVYSGAADGSTTGSRAAGDTTLGRWPANIIHDASEEVLAAFPDSDGASVARFFYAAKADGHDRLGSKHPTVKPVDLMQWLVRLVTKKGGTVLDPFAGTGTTGEAAWREGMKAILIEREEEYQQDIARRMEAADSPMKRAMSVRQRPKPDSDAPNMFEELAE